MSDVQPIVNAVYRFFGAVDGRDWSTAEQLMRDPFHLDYSSFGAGEPADLPPGDVLGGWAQLLPGFDSTHHQLGNLDVEAAEGAAVVEVYGTATHVIGDRSWVVIGSYRIPLARGADGWVLTGVEFRFKAQLGDLGLPAEAQARAAEEATR